MTQETKHTPLPYRMTEYFAGDTAGEYLWSVYSGDENNLKTIADYRAYSYKDKRINGKKEAAEVERKQATAEFIVRACNSHYELLEAISLALEIAKSETMPAGTLSKKLDRISQILDKAEGK